MRYAEMNRCGFRKRLTKSGVMRAPSRIPSARYFRLSAALIGERRLLDLRIPNGQPGKAGAAALQSLCAADSPDLLILITLPRPDAAAQKSAWYHALLNAGVVVCIERVERAHLPNWLKQRLEAQNQRAPAGEEGARALQWLAERV